jgi:hypothetical protein
MEWLCAARLFGHGCRQPVDIGARVGHRCAQIISRRVIGVSGFHVGDQRGAEHLLAAAQALQRDPVAVENRCR